MRTITKLAIAPGFIVTYPATVAHELTHYLAAWPIATQLDYSIGRSYIDIEYGPAAPQWARRGSAVAPTVVGIVFALAALTAVWGGVYSPRERTVIEYAIIGAWWLQYVYPGAGDRALFWGGAE